MNTTTKTVIEYLGILIALALIGLFVSNRIEAAGKAIEERQNATQNQIDEVHRATLRNESKIDHISSILEDAYIYQ